MREAWRSASGVALGLIGIAAQPEVCPWIMLTS